MVIARDLLLDLFKNSGAGLDPLDLTLVLAVVQANVAAISARPDLQVRFGGRDSLAPDDLRRPIAINALALSVGTPFETVRRRIQRLAANGVCDILPAGVVVPRRALAAAENEAAMERNVELLRSVYRRLRAVSFLEAPEPGTLAGAVDPLELPRIAARLSSAYFLRMTEPVIGLVGSISDTFIIMQMQRDNTAHLGDVRGPDIQPAGQLVADDLKRPVTLARVASELRMSHETVRRRVRRFIETGRCVKVDGGYIVPRSTLARSQLVQAMMRNHTNLTRLFRGLESWGFLAVWEAERAEIAA